MQMQETIPTKTPVSSRLLTSELMCSRRRLSGSVSATTTSSSSSAIQIMAEYVANLSTDLWGDRRESNSRTWSHNPVLYH